MIRVETPTETVATALTSACGPEDQHHPLSSAESPVHLFTQYSVRRTSRIGRFAGGVNLATWFTLANAAM